jgi:hypothetical protein
VVVYPLAARVLELNSGDFQRPKQLPQGALLTLEWMVGLGLGASSRDPDRTRNSCYNGETHGGVTRGRVCPCGLCLKSVLECFNVLENPFKG